MKLLTSIPLMFWLTAAAVADDVQSENERPQRPDSPVSRKLGLLPGLYQCSTGQTTKCEVYAGGSALTFGVALSSGILSVYYGNQAEDWRGDYEDLPPSLPQSDYDHAFDNWQSFQEKSDTTAKIRNVGLVMFGVLYAASWLDVIRSPPRTRPLVSRSVQAVVYSDERIVWLALRFGKRHQTVSHGQEYRADKARYR